MEEKELKRIPFDELEKEPAPEIRGVSLDSIVISEENFLNLCYERDDRDLNSTGETIDYILSQYFGVNNMGLTEENEYYLP